MRRPTPSFTTGISRVVTSTKWRAPCCRRGARLRCRSAAAQPRGALPLACLRDAPLMWSDSCSAERPRAPPVDVRRAFLLALPFLGVASARAEEESAAAAPVKEVDIRVLMGSTVLSASRGLRSRAIYPFSSPSSVCCEPQWALQPSPLLARRPRPTSLATKSTIRRYFFLCPLLELTTPVPLTCGLL